MESKSIVIHKGGKEEKYKLYVEDYVLSYLKYETGSLECSEIYFYGTRQRGEKKYVIYGAGRDKQIPVFDTYDLLEEIMCRLTQAGPVFMVRESEEIYQIKGFDIFYQDNQAMQSYMVERQRLFNKPQTAKKQDRHEPAGIPVASMGKAETKPAHSHGMMSAQLGIILIILVAIVINSANSYDKMEQLNQSAEEVFFAIENQEADDSVADGYEPEEEIVVEREKDQEEDDQGYDRGNDQKNEEDRDTGNMTETKQSKDENPEQEQSGSDKLDGDESEGVLEAVDVQKADSENVKEESAEHEGDQTEALSRNVTRYYKVEKGDTLYTICQKIYGDISQVEKICELNDIADPDRIRSGQKIILP